MTKTIWKYTLKLTDIQIIPMPKGTEILSAHKQGNEICIWMLVHTTNSEDDYEDRIIEITITGNPIVNDPRKFIGTVVFPVFVWHIFERLQ